MKKTLLALAAAAVLAGCSTPSSQAPTELEDYNSIAEPDVVWSKNVGESLTNYLVPSVVGTSVYAAGDNTIYRLDAETGDEVWSFETDAPIAAGVGSDGYIVAEKGNVLLICKKEDSSALIRKYINEVQVKYGEEFI